MIFPRKTLIAAMMASTALCLIAPALALAETRKPAEQVKVNYQSFTLSNGLKVLVYTDHTSPNVFIGVWYKVGSKDEPVGRYGFAHLFEHLMFQQTEHRKSEFFVDMDEIGATDVNGTTTTDRTNYFEIVPTNGLDRALWIESDRMGYLPGGITQDILNAQRAVVENEKRQGELQPASKAHEIMLRSFYAPAHPYAHSTIGSEEDLDRATLSDVKQWFADHYGPANAVLVLSGDIDLDTAKQKVGAYFGAIPGGKRTDYLDEWVPEIGQIKRDVMYDAVSVTTVSRNWHVANDNPRNITLLQMAAKTLAGAQNSFLNKELVDQQQIAYSVTAGVEDSVLGSALNISMALKPGVSEDSARAALDAALQKYYRQGPDPVRLNSVIKATHIALVHSMESNSAMGKFLIEGEVAHGDPLFFMKQLEWISNTSVAEVQAVAKEWINRPYYEMVLRPQLVSHTQSSAIDRTKMPDATPATYMVKFPPMQETTLSNGMKLVVAERHNAPLVEISMQFNTGSFAEGTYGHGVAQQAFNLMSMGTKKYPGNELTKEVQRIGLNATALAADRQSAFNWTALTKDLDSSFALSSDIIRHPLYPNVEIDKREKDEETKLEDYERNPINSGPGLFNRAIWGEQHPYGWINTPKNHTPASRETIVRFHDTELGPNNATLYMVGDISLDRAKALAEHYFGDWKPVTPTPVGPVPAPQGQKGRIILVDAPGTPQASITVGHIIAPFDPNTSAAQSLMSAALGGGFNGRLNMKLREEKGWAYGYRGGITTAPVGPGVFMASGTVQTDKAALSMTEIKKVITGFVTDLPETQVELDRDKTASIRAVPSAFTNSAEFMRSMVTSASYGLPLTRAEGAAERLAAVTLDDVRHQAITTIKPDELTWVVVGDLNVIEKDIRAQNLGPVEVWDTYGHRVR